MLWTLAALASHWRRHPANLATLILGLAIATALWSGVQALNAQARKSYDSAAAAISGDGARMLVATHGGLFAQELFVKLRRAGVECLSGVGGRDPDRRQESARHRRRAAHLAAPRAAGAYA